MSRPSDHTFIRNLLDEVERAAAAEGILVTALQKVAEVSNPCPAGIVGVTTNDRPIAALQNRDANLVGGTAWLWSRSDYANAVDVLVIDEAGQISLANVLAVGQAARNIILLGDPQQLDQPTQGAHPVGTDASALAHLLGSRETIPEDRGLFLSETWRLHPAICGFVSEVFCEGRLTPHEGLERQRVDGHNYLGPAGLWLVPIDHTGNTTTAEEEVERARMCTHDIRSGATNEDQVKIKHEFVEFIPKEREEGLLYLSIPYATAVHNYFCGCGLKVVSPNLPDWLATDVLRRNHDAGSVRWWSKFPPAAHTISFVATLSFD